MIEYICGRRRNTRIIRDDYTVICHKCGQWKDYYTAFYLRHNVYAFEDRGTEVEWFCLPSGKCRACSRIPKPKLPGIPPENGGTVDKESCPEDHLIDNIVTSIKKQQSRPILKKSPLTDDDLKRMGYGSP